MTQDELSFIKNHGYLFRIKSANNFVVFLLGYYSASIVYNLNDRTVPLFLDKLIRDVNNPKIQWQNAGKYFDLFSNSSSAARNNLIDDYKMLIENKIIFDNKEESSVFLLDLLMDVNNFDAFLRKVKNNLIAFNITSIEDLFVLLIGFSYKGDHIKNSTSIFEKFKDTTFIDIYSTSNEIQTTIQASFKLHPTSNWVDMLTYLSSVYPSKSSLDLFFEIADSIIDSRRDN